MVKSSEERSNNHGANDVDDHVATVALNCQSFCAKLDEILSDLSRSRVKPWCTKKQLVYSPDRSLRHTGSGKMPHLIVHSERMKSVVSVR